MIYTTLPWIRIGFSLAVLLICLSDGTARPSDEELQRGYRKVLEEFDKGSTATALLKAEDYLEQVGDLWRLPETSSDEEWLDLWFRGQLTAGVSSAMFWAACDEHPKYGSAIKYGNQAVSAAMLTYSTGYVDNKINDYDIANILLALGYLEESDGKTSAAIARYKASASYAEKVNKVKGFSSELLYIQGNAFGYLVHVSAESTDTEHLNHLGKKSLELRIKGIASQTEYPDEILGLAEEVYEWGLWLLYVEAISLEEVEAYIAKLEALNLPAVDPVIAALYHLRGNWDNDYGQLSDASRFYQNALTRTGQDQADTRVSLLWSLGCVAVEMSDKAGVDFAVSKLSDIIAGGNLPSETLHSAKVAFTSLESEKDWNRRDAGKIISAQLKILNLDGFDLENAEHFFSRSFALANLVYLSQDSETKLSHLEDLKELVAQVDRLDPELSYDHATTDAQNLIVFAEAEIYGHFWFDEAPGVIYSEEIDGELAAWSVWDIYVLFEKAYWEQDFAVMQSAEKELMRRGVSEECLQELVWLLEQ